MTGTWPPLETERQARELPLVRQIHATPPGTGQWGALNLAMLSGVTGAAGIETGAFDKRILSWLSGFESETCAAVAGLIARAHAAGRADAQQEHCPYCGHRYPAGRAATGDEITAHLTQCPGPGDGCAAKGGERP